MARFSFLTRAKRAGVLFNQTEHGVQLARLGRLDEKPLTIDALAELAPMDDDGLERWLEKNFPDRTGGYLAAYCGFHPPERVLIRETVDTRRIPEPDYLSNLLAGSARLPSANNWFIRALDPVEGEVFTVSPQAAQRPSLLLGLPLASVRELQLRMRKPRILPHRLEVGTVALLGALTQHMRQIAYPHAVVACELGQTQTRIYLLGKDGVHTPAALPHGLLSIEESAMKELNVADVAAARRALEAPTEELRGHGRRLVRALTRHLKPAIDYFEMQTGQPIGALFCAHLPARLAWVEEALCAAVDLEFLAPNLETWLPTVGLQLAEGTAVPDRCWFQAFSLVGKLTPPLASAAHEQNP
jgi:hypothetical protein